MMNLLKRWFHFHTWRDVPGMMEGHGIEQCICGSWRRKPKEETWDEYEARIW